MKNFVKTVLSTTGASLIGTFMGAVLMTKMFVRSFKDVPMQWKRLILGLPLKEDEKSENTNR